MEFYIGTEKWEVNALAIRDEIALVTPHARLPGREYKDYRLSAEEAKILGEMLIQGAERLERLKVTA